LFGSGKSPGQVSLRHCGGSRNRPLAALARAAKDPFVCGLADAFGDVR